MGAIPGALTGVAIVVFIGDKIDFVFKLLSMVMITWAIIKTVRKMKSDQILVQGETATSSQVETLTSNWNRNRRYSFKCLAIGAG